MNQDIRNRRQALYWRMLGAAFGHQEQGENFERMAIDITDELNMPRLLLDGRVSVDDFLHRHPEMEDEFQLDLNQHSDDEGTLRKALIISKLMLNVFGPNTQQNTISAAQYSQWLKDVEHLERCLGYQPGTLRRGGQSGQSSSGGSGRNGSGGTGKGGMLRPGMGSGDSGAGFGTGEGFLITDEDLRDAIMGMEKDLIDRMQLREVLKDNKLANQLVPSMSLVEQLLRDKSNLSGNALNNAKRIIRSFVDELAEVLKLQVAQAPSGKIDYSVPPKRVFRNLDVKRTIWRNLPNWNPDEKCLYVDKFFYKHSAKKKIPTRMIVVVDQSGSMVDAMVQCTILASIFATLPHVDVHLLAFDTRTIDLTAYVHDPFEVLLRTELGGGTHINAALTLAAEKILEPKQTVMILITDFYEGGSDEVLLNTIKRIKESGVHFFPVGAVTSSGYFSVNQWFRTKLKELGMPILTGTPKKLIRDLKKVIVT